MVVRFASLQLIKSIDTVSCLYFSLANKICCSGSHLELPCSFQRGGRVLLFVFVFYFQLIRTSCFSGLLDLSEIGALPGQCYVVWMYVLLTN